MSTLRVIPEIAALALAVFVVSAFLTRAMRRIALLHGVIDVPNERSSHNAPTPRGGGVAIVGAATAAFAVLALIGTFDFHLLLALIGGGAAIGLIGFLDDRSPLPAGVRLAVHIVAAIWAVYWIGGLPAIRTSTTSIDPGFIGNVFAALALVWMTNLFNFMDGIDGLAGAETSFVSLTAAALIGHSVGMTGVPSAAICLGAASLGFLVWNWPPAKIFMGDVGSGFLGYSIAVLALFTTHEEYSSGLVWLILAGVFIADATVTLVRRLLRGERVHEAHRSHAYQWLARRWGSHRKVTIAVLLCNVFWLGPWALLACYRKELASVAALAALLPLFVAALALGAGRPECAD